MPHPLVRTRSTVLAAAAVVALSLGLSGRPPPAPTTATSPAPATRLFTPPPDKGAVQQIAQLAKTHQWSDAARAHKMAATPQAVWFTKGTPAEVKKSVQKTMLQATAHAHDARCSSRTTSRSATARSTPRAARPTRRATWPGSTGSPPASATRQAIVLVEPDGLGIIPWYTDHQRRAGVVPAGRRRPGDRGLRPVRAAQRRRRPASTRPAEHEASTSTARTAAGSASATSPTGCTRPASSGPTASSSTCPTTRPPRRSAEVRRLDLAVPLVRHQPGRGRLARSVTSTTARASTTRPRRATSARGA